MINNLYLIYITFNIKPYVIIIIQYLANEYGYDKFMNNLLNSDIPLDR